MKQIILMLLFIILLFFGSFVKAEEKKYDAIYFSGTTNGKELMPGVYNQDGYTYAYFPEEGHLLSRSGDGYIQRTTGKINYNAFSGGTNVKVTYSEARTALNAYSTDQSSFANTWGYEEEEVFPGAGLIRELLENLKEFFRGLARPFTNVLERIRDVSDGIFGGVVEGFKKIGKAISDFFDYLNPTKEKNLWKDLFFDADGIKEDFLKIYGSKKELQGVIASAGTATVFGMTLNASLLATGDSVLAGMVGILLGLEAFNRIDDFMKGE